MNQIPHPGGGAELRRRYAIQAIVANNHKQAEHKQPRWAQMNKRGHDDHANSENPENEKEYGVPGRDVEVIGKLHDGQLQHDKPKSTCPQKKRELSVCATASPQPKKRANPGREHENGQAKVSNPAREEQDCSGFREIGGRKGHRADVEEVAHMIEGHENHDQSAKRVNTGEACGWLGGRMH